VRRLGQQGQEVIDLDTMVARLAEEGKSPL